MPKVCRYFSVFLCLILILTVAISPIQAKAYYFANPGMSALFSMFWSSDLSTDTAEGLASVLQAIWDNLSVPVQNQLNYYVTSDQTSFKVTDAQANSFLTAFKAVMVSAVFKTYKVRHMFVDLDNEEITAEDVVAADTELIIPTEEQLKNFEVLSAQELIVESNKLIKKTNSILQNMSYALHGFNESFAKDFASFSSMMHSYLSSVTDWCFTINDTIKVKFGVVTDWLSTINTNIVTKINLLSDWFPTINENMKVRLDTVATWLSTLNTNMKSEFGQVKDWLKGIKTAINTQGTQIYQKLDSIEKQILVFPKYDDDEQIEIIQKPQIQVQITEQEQILVTDYASLTQAAEKKFSWVEQIFDFLKELRSRLGSGKPPKIPINLSAAEGSVNWGTEAYVLDLSWYERYKPTVDKLISGILWLCFGWAIYKRIPDILSGIGLTVENATQEPGHIFTNRSDRAQERAERSQVRSAQLSYYERRK